MLTHHPSAVAVFKSPDYENFTMIKGNRPLNQKKIDRIIKEINAGNDILDISPIHVKLVDEKLAIMDGQHRFFIAKKLKRAVHYIIVPDQKTMHEIAVNNSNVEKWKQQDFINCYIQNGNEHYIKLQVFIDLYNFNIGTSVRLLSNGTPGTEGTNQVLTEIFEYGNFKVTHWDESVKIAEMCKLFAASPIYNDRSFVIAIYRIYKAGIVTIESVAEAFRKYPELLIKQVNYKNYIINLEQIANKNKQKRIVII